ncbi:signal recognition particle-docking protein FtsY [Lentilactobacillus otakiensis DSM 19908 = JCM 15040]|uniref:Signal recognition particle receptor FtsY n=1 Tax=Lentilactobacillus otakiensis DSM 19908 = JCM 15040 TaxID=1423780 RepID=S4PN94_9LACO|nr:signal recognition particle-docking protein FtsY [Lentilactobacillus otakiensis]KRL09231.1 signal recognition particle-docking protein FtsY [Lentilactobacillus otakiensis DSM 19908 = JCM 15040]MDV3519067.1 signal recognition particle-docking protein FtsY [Lentilactobacillus otakiensis]GAD15765.1 signal recognition particle receptor FtsY [Lentilactobacillus otakiensis DSM 19908 = JCM 15040]
MGLFDIFKRRSKKNEEKEPEKSTEQTEPATETPAKEEVQPSPSSAVSTSDESPKQTTDPSADVQTTEKSAQQADEQPEEPSSTPTEPTKEAPSQPQEETKENTQEPGEEASQTSQAGQQPEADEHNEAAAESTTVQYEKGLEKSRSSFGEKLNALLANFRHVDESFFDNLEDMLIESDVGFETSMRITDELRDEVKLQNAKKPKDVQNVIVKKLIDMYDKAGNGENPAINMAKSGPTVILFVGVNGVGKTTTIGKMAKMYKDQGKKVVLAAADTFRAGAIEQLNVWAVRDGVDIVKGKAKSDPASVVYDAVQKARDDNYDVLMVDTAGRLQNKVNLMNELSKMKKILTREIPEAPHEVLLVLDATTGQNAMTQAKMFKEATDVTGIVLTKLDGTARGGIVLAIRSELHLPVKYVGLGEKVTDLKPFDPNDFVYGLFKGLISE